MHEFKILEYLGDCIRRCRLNNCWMQTYIPSAIPSALALRSVVKLSMAPLTLQRHMALTNGQSLQQDAAELSRRLHKLERVPLRATEGSPALQTALLILRSVWPGACLHLHRQLPPNLTQECTETVQDRFYHTLQTLLKLPELSNPHKPVITLPIAHGGLPFPHLPTLALAARISMFATKTPANQPYFESHLRDELTHLGTRFDDLIEGRTADLLGQIIDPPLGRSFRGLQKKLMTQHNTYTSREFLSVGPEHHRLLDAWFAHHSTDNP